MTRPDQTGRGSHRGSLSIDLILDEAMQLAREDGLAGLSMRRVAARLGVEAMSMYHYVPSKAALLVLMADRSAAAVLSTDLAPGEWHQQLVELLMRTYQAGVRNAALFEVLAAEPLRVEDLPTVYPAAGSALIGLLERVLALLRNGSLSDLQVAHTFSGLIGPIIGFIVVQVDGLPLPSRTAGAGRARESRLAAMEPALRGSDPADGLRPSLQLFLDGLVRLQTQAIDR